MAFQAQQPTLNDDSWRTEDDVTMPRYKEAPERRIIKAFDISQGLTYQEVLTNLKISPDALNGTTPEKEAERLWRETSIESQACSHSDKLEQWQLEQPIAATKPAPELSEDQLKDYSYASTDWSFADRLANLNIGDHCSVNTPPGQMQAPLINVAVEEPASRGSKKKRKRSRHPKRGSVGVDSSMAPSQSKQPKTEVAGNKVLPKATEEEWKERIRKRKEGLANTKAQIFYTSNEATLLAKGKRPDSPDPENRCFSKRDWERETSEWRNIYRNADLMAYVRTSFPACGGSDEDMIEDSCWKAMSSIHGDEKELGCLEKLENETKAAYQERLHKKRKACALAIVQARMEQA